LNNLVWAFGGRSFLGAPDKPLVPRLTRAIKAAGMHAGDAPTRPSRPHRLLENMNVGVLRAAATRTDLLPGVAPYVYTQSRVILLPEEEQMNRLVYSDCRLAVCVNEDWTNRSPSTAQPVSAPGDLDSFASLQQTNRIVRVDQEQPNRTIIEADIRVPAMLVLAECRHPGWRATVNGRPARVERVNYLQQGVWLEPGWRTVEMRFFPASLKYGIGVSVASWLVFLGAVIAAGRCGGRRR
jgi:hypothetical protein